jgi:hypothetical protein
MVANSLARSLFPVLLPVFLVKLDAEALDLLASGSRWPLFSRVRFGATASLTRAGPAPLRVKYIWSDQCNGASVLKQDGVRKTLPQDALEYAISKRQPSRRFLLWRLMAFSRVIHKLDFDFS